MNGGLVPSGLIKPYNKQQYLLSPAPFPNMTRGLENAGGNEEAAYVPTAWRVGLAPSAYVKAWRDKAAGTVAVSADIPGGAPHESESGALPSFNTAGTPSRNISVSILLRVDLSWSLSDQMWRSIALTNGRHCLARGRCHGGVRFWGWRPTTNIPPSARDGGTKGPQLDWYPTGHLLGTWRSIRKRPTAMGDTWTLCSCVT